VLIAGCAAGVSGCSDNDDDDDDVSDDDDTDTTPPYTTTDTVPDSDSGSGFGDTDGPPEPPSCDDGFPVHIVGGAGFTELQAALDAADAGAVLLLCRGTYAGPFVAPVPLTLIGIDGADFTILDGGGLGTTLTLQPTSSMSGIRVTAGSAVAGGGVVLTGAGSYEITDSAILSNDAEEGGGIWAAPGARVWLSGTVVADNHADRGGGIYADIGVDVDATDGRIEANVAEDNGAGVYALAGFTLLSGVISLNTVLGTDDTSGGGGLYMVGPGALTGTVLEANVAHRGGAVRADDAALLTLMDVAVDANVATDLSAADGRGGGLYVQGGQVTVAGVSTVTANDADLGGGVFVAADGVLSGASITGNTAISGGGVYLQAGTASMLTVAGNTADTGGGVVIDDAGTLSASAVTMNVAAADGGGVAAGTWLADSLAAGVLELSSVTVSDNDAVTGAGISVTGEVTVSLTDASTVEANTATVAGGGAWVADTATLTSDASSWGEDLLDNGPDDVVAGATSYTGYTAAETFTCVSGACDPAP
jgi:hypothetical protein